MSQGKQLTAAERVDDTMDRYLALVGRMSAETQGVRTKHLARLTGVSRARMSVWLGQHRLAQRGHGTRYILGSRGYGPAARWFLLSKPRTDPQAVRAERINQMKYDVSDHVVKWRRSYSLEIAPGLRARDLISDMEIEELWVSVDADLRRIAHRAERRMAMESSGILA